VNVALRPYQTDLVTGLRTAMASGHRRVLGVLPTGGGKGRILAHIPASAALKGSNVLIIAHRSELVDQISANLDAEGVPHGRIQAGHATVQHPVMVGMVQTIARRLDRVTVPKLLLIDECHHVPSAQNQAIISAWPDARLIGVTATPIRGDGKGLGNDFTNMVCGPSVADLIKAGHLAAYDYYLPSPRLDLSTVRIVRGDYSTGGALEAMEAARIVGDAVVHYQRHLAGRPAIAFCMDVAHAHGTAATFRAAGIRSAAIDGTMAKDARAGVLAALASGELDVLCAAEIVSEGVDIPAVAGAILLRPTMSLGLMMQQCGRALRPKPDGGRAVILDHVGNAHRHGFPDDPRTWTLDSKPNKPPAPRLRTCAVCFRVFHFADAEPCGNVPCGLETPDRAEPDDIVTAEGDLELVGDRWAWAEGIDVLTAQGGDYARMMKLAHHNEARLTQIQRARGYKRGWIWHQKQAR